MSDTVIKVENLSKLYRLGEVGTGSLAHDVNRWWHRVRGREDPYSKVGQINDRTKKAESDWVWALKDINFEVSRGEVLGIIGRNGAGKSTLLKILSSVTAPTSGLVKVRGRIAALLEVGTGFHPELTGRDNIFLNGAILGMSKVEIRSKLDEIVSFSGCEAYLDTPVKRYSSGMQVRLAFAVAAHLEPEILIIDEVLAVGDAEFQKKCMGRMSEVAGEGRTVLFVSHNMTSIQALCRSAILLSGGTVAGSGAVEDCMACYLGTVVRGEQLCWVRESSRVDRPVSFENIQGRLIGKSPNLQLELMIQMRSLKTSVRSMIAADICDVTSVVVMQALPRSEPFITVLQSGTDIQFLIDLPPLIPGHYTVSLWLGSHYTETFDEVPQAVSFEIVNSPTSGRTFPHSRSHGAVVPLSRVALLDAAGTIAI